jgi:hypothetical protein
MAVPPGSFTQALRVGSGRGPTLRTALRGARSERVEHATGSICSGRVNTRLIDGRDVRAPQSSPLPNLPNCRRLQEAPVRSHYGGDAHPKYRCGKIAQVPEFLRFTMFPVGTLWRGKSRSLNSQWSPDTRCGNVNPHRHMQVGAWGEASNSPIRPRYTGTRALDRVRRKGHRPSSRRTIPRSAGARRRAPARWDGTIGGGAGSRALAG